MASLDEWWEAGRRVELLGHGIFVRELGDGPHMTLLHGLPSSSHEWAKIVPALAERHALLLCDLLGFGASDKPQDHDFSLYEQADIVEALWRDRGIEATILVAHDYAATVAQELLARRADGALAVELERVCLMNGGLYPDLHRPEPIQTALLDPVQGPQIAAAMTEELLIQALRPTFGDPDAALAEGADIWREVSSERNIFHRLMHYIPERRANAERWTGALERTDVPLSFVWGMRDPISGAHMAERIRERCPDARFTALEDVGHWPMLEAPDRVIEALR